MRIQIRFRPITYFLVGFVVVILSLALITLIGERKYNSAENAVKLKLNSYTTTKPARNFSISEMMGSSNTVEVVRPNVTTILLEPSMPFLKHNGKRPFAVILVTSMARSFRQRQTIRNTWYKWGDDLDIRIFFAIGFQDFMNMELFQILEQEQSIHNDLIVDEYEEGYYSLPGKVLRMLKWYSSTYSDDNAPRFVIKTDQDVFLNLPNIALSLKQTPYYKNLVLLSNLSNETASLPDAVNLPFDPMDPETYYVGGRRFENSPIESDPDSKWYIDTAERERLSWPLEFFPTYTNGPCYIMSGNVVKSIYEASFNVPIYPFEDVYIVGMIAYDQLDLYISNLEGMWLDRSYFCFIKIRSKFRKMLALHPVEHPYVMVRLCRKIPSCKTNLEVTRLPMSASGERFIPTLPLVLRLLIFTVLHLRIS